MRLCVCSCHLILYISSKNGSLLEIFVDFDPHICNFKNLSAGANSIELFQTNLKNYYD